MTAANVADGLMLVPLLDQFPVIRGPRDRLRTRPILVMADNTARVEELHRRGVYPSGVKCCDFLRTA